MSESSVKEGFVGAECEVTPEEMEEINRYTRREFAPEEVYTFSLVLCDNEADRDFERFSIPALEKLKELFLGKTCILDHERKSANQTARIYRTALEQEPERVTESGEPYTRLTAKAYLPRTQRSQETIELIESGILKEVSISCQMGRSVCSVCGEEDCDHEKGKVYHGSACLRVWQEPTDAYECSFVAVPAQREAGVRKSFAEDGNVTLEKRLKEAALTGEGLSPAETRKLFKRFEELTGKATAGEAYCKSLKESALRYCAVLEPGLPRDVMGAAFEGLSVDELVKLNRAFAARAEKCVPLRPQLAPEGGKEVETAEAKGTAAFRI